MTLDIDGCISGWCHAKFKRPGVLCKARQGWVDLLKGKVEGATQRFIVTCSML